MILINDELDLNPDDHLNHSHVIIQSFLVHWNKRYNHIFDLQTDLYSGTSVIIGKMLKQKMQSHLWFTNCYQQWDIRKPRNDEKLAKSFHLDITTNNDTISQSSPWIFGTPQTLIHHDVDERNHFLIIALTLLKLDKCKIEQIWASRHFDLNDGASYKVQFKSIFDGNSDNK